MIEYLKVNFKITANLFCSDFKVCVDPVLTLPVKYMILVKKT